ncbi:hypothetical protein GN244_ATG11465 [Phytophthora infestans]|uniref:Myb/SANT-like domain-containing protein n=1 Tax=Phytophthora infestans TaxID=4787 RepID=A0A833T4L9_PHYIN|nr:hypothetical protein GN244_ATG11465 [Phytophthora infestans]KAF4128721.1 hypothetical protein GN958_ATG22143 [Phytophthora infestans]
MKQAWGYQRAVWDHARERVLLDVFEKTRRDPKLRTDRGLKGLGWDSVAEQVNDRCKSTFNVDQLKSKYARLMMDSELFNDVGGKRNLSDEHWDQLILDMPDSAPRLSIFKKSGFPHCDICRRIAIERDELTVSPRGTPTTRTAKRSSGTIGQLSETKRARLFTWGPNEKKLVLFLCWKAKIEREKAQASEEATKPQQVFLEATTELNKHCKTNFTEEQFKDKYLQLMQTYEQFKQLTGFSGDLDAFPKSDKDWDKLIQEHPENKQELEQLKKNGDFPHVELCSLIAGDNFSDEVELASVSEFLLTGTLQRSEVQDELNTESINAVAAAQASTLSQLLPATAMASTGQVDPLAGAAPATMTQELHDNLNMFLKTATAYLVMAINDHNQGANK